MFTYLYSSILVSTYVYACLPRFTPVYSCLPMFTCFDLSLSLFTLVYQFLVPRTKTSTGTNVIQLKNYN